MRDRAGVRRSSRPLWRRALRRKDRRIYLPDAIKDERILSAGSIVASLQRRRDGAVARAARVGRMTKSSALGRAPGSRRSSGNSRGSGSSKIRRRRTFDRRRGTRSSGRRAPLEPHRVSRRSMTQDAAHAKATAHAQPMREKFTSIARDPAARPDTRRESKAITPPMKLQTVCGRVHDLLTWTVDELPAPRVREGDRVNGSALVYAIPRSHSHTHDPKP